jgi:hypothetical protein
VGGRRIRGTEELQLTPVYDARSRSAKGAVLPGDIDSPAATVLLCSGTAWSSNSLGRLQL